MNKLAGFILTVIIGTTVGWADDVAEMPKPQKEHEWLQQLAGKWEYEGQMVMEAGQAPVKSKGMETVRSIGGFWIVAETKGTFQGAPFTGLLTLGYNSEKRRYVGTWIDSTTGHLWTYEGVVDKSGKILTLETEGPTAPGKLSRFKEVLEIKSKEHRVFTSSVQGEDGKWTTMMTINYRRTK